VRDERAAQQVARAIGSALAVSINGAAGTFDVSASIGIALFPDDAVEFEELIRRADRAMYDAKSRGRGNCVTFGQLGGATDAAPAAVDAELAAAIAAKALVVRYDPRVDTVTGRVEAVVARLVWPRPDQREVPPPLLLELLQQRGHLARFTRRLFKTAAQDVARWRATLRPDLRLVLEASRAQFRDPDFVPALTDALATAALDPAQVDLDVRQEVFAQTSDEVARVERSLHALGVRLFLADLGAGELSLARYTGHALHGFRIAREVIDGVVADPHQAALTRALLELARALDLAVVAAGVTTEAQAEFLRRHGCDRLEGPLFGTELTAETVGERVVADSD
jgi:predicted signal transduction protein with EAL and GGDEF domain